MTAALEYLGDHPTDPMVLATDLTGGGPVALGALRFGGPFSAFL